MYLDTAAAIKDAHPVWRGVVFPAQHPETKRNWTSLTFVRDRLQEANRGDNTFS